MSDTHPSPIINDFLTHLTKPTAITSNTLSNPNYFACSPSTLLSTAKTPSFTISTGSGIYTHYRPALLSTTSSLTIVTCFWSRSSTLTTLNSILRQLSSRHDTYSNNPKIKVRICFSSVSLTQKLFHTRSPSGKIWPASTWVSKLGLPDPLELTGLGLKVKSIFVLPFSVMHPKFIIVDDQTVLLPSCNVSWEEWLEGCIELQGEIVGQFQRFYNRFWADEDDLLPMTTPDDNMSIEHSQSPTKPTPTGLPPQKQCLFLPSPHHPNPHFTLPLPFLTPQPPHPTPLNTFLLTAFSHAKQSIIITTPNLTSLPVITTLLSALSRGVDVTIYTSPRMMVLEQLLTAGTITELCVWSLRHRYHKMLRQHARTANPAETLPATKPAMGSNSSTMNTSMRSSADLVQHNNNTDSQIPDSQIPDIEAQQTPIGALRVFYFSPPFSSPLKIEKLHFKSTIIDNNVIVLGSGNMDRASWWTSQELGVAFFGEDVMKMVKEEWERLFEIRMGGGDQGGGWFKRVI